MPTQLRVVILEDRPADAELMVHELCKAGFAPEWRCVSTESDFLATLDTPIDVILADFRLPGFTALEALRHIKERNLGIPFIIITGTLGDEMAAALTGLKLPNGTYGGRRGPQMDPMRTASQRNRRAEHAVEGTLQCRR